MTMYGICELSQVPVRRSPSDQSEMVNQLLFGDIVTIESIDNQWMLISTSHDSYEGWVDTKQISIIDKTIFDRLVNETPFFISSIMTRIESENIGNINIAMGSRLTSYITNRYSINENHILKKQDQEKVTTDIINNAMKYLGAPYMWGGRSPFGIDCSGFTQVVFGMCGINLKRDTYLQAKLGSTIDFINEANTGDLVFFDNDESKITHVGILIDDKQIIHASGEVRIDSIDHNGIYNENEKRVFS